MRDFSIPVEIGCYGTILLSPQLLRKYPYKAYKIEKDMKKEVHEDPFSIARKIARGEKYLVVLEGNYDKEIGLVPRG